MRSFAGGLFYEDGSICIPAYALEFCVLTATRAGETLGCRWQEIDLIAKLWIIPEERMKAGGVLQSRSATPRTP